MATMSRLHGREAAWIDALLSGCWQPDTWLYNVCLSPHWRADDISCLYPIRLSRCHCQSLQVISFWLRLWSQVDYTYTSRLHDRDSQSAWIGPSYLAVDNLTVTSLASRRHLLSTQSVQLLVVTAGQEQHLASGTLQSPEPKCGT